MTIQLRLGLIALGCAAAVSLGAAPALAADLYPLGGDLPVCEPGSAERMARDTQALKAIDADAGQRGFAALKAHLPELEAMLAHAPKVLNKVERCGDKIVVHTNSPNESLLAMMFYSVHAKDLPAGVNGASAVYSPYPHAAFFIGAYYDEYSQWDRALPPMMRGLQGDPTDPVLTTEAALPLEQMHRPAEALALCDRTLQGNALMDAKDKARVQRCRGYALAELRRFDEAEAAYHASLDIDPGNRVALGELTHIADMRQGGPGGVRQTVNSATGQPSPPH
jgi:tetratricopeptide (TPR) repeat protein